MEHPGKFRLRSEKLVRRSSGGHRSSWAGRAQAAIGRLRVVGKAAAGRKEHARLRHSRCQWHVRCPCLMGHWRSAPWCCHYHIWNGLKALKRQTASGWMDGKSKRLHSALYSPLQMTILKHTLLPVVLFVPVVLQRVVIDQIEEQHASSGQLQSLNFDSVRWKYNLKLPAAREWSHSTWAVGICGSSASKPFKYHQHQSWESCDVPIHSVESRHTWNDIESHNTEVISEKSKQS